MEKNYAIVDKAKVARLQTHKRKLKLIQMEEKETISEFTTRIARLVNQVKAWGETVTEQYVVAKILCYLTLRFDNVVVVIKELKDLVITSKEGLQSSLEAHEQRMKESNIHKTKVKISLQASLNERDKKAKRKWLMNKGGRNFQNLG